MITINRDNAATILVALGRYADNLSEGDSQALFGMSVKEFNIFVDNFYQIIEDYDSQL